VGIFIVIALCIAVSLISARMLGYNFGFKTKKSAYDEWNEWMEARARDEQQGQLAMNKDARLDKVRSEVLSRHNPVPLRRTFVGEANDVQMVDVGRGPVPSKRLDVGAVFSMFSGAGAGAGAASAPANEAGLTTFDTRGSNAGLDQIDVGDLYEVHLLSAPHPPRDPTNPFPLPFSATGRLLK
jgi:hypothetical protein